MEYLIICLLFFIIYATELIGQKEKNSFLSLNIGVANIARQDLIFSPFIHKDLSFLQFALKYRKQSDFMHLIEAI